MKVREQPARALLKALGYKAADTMSEAMVVRKLESMEVDVPDRVRLAVKDATLSRLMNTIAKAVKKGDGVELLRETAPAVLSKIAEIANKAVNNQREVKGDGQKEVPPSTRRPVCEVDEGDEEVVLVPSQKRSREEVIEEAREELEDEEAEAAKPLLNMPRRARSSKEEFPDLVETVNPPPAKGTQRRAVFEMLRRATMTLPMTKTDVLLKLRHLFPDSPPTSLASTVDGFTYWLPKCFPFKVRRLDSGYWLEPIKDEGPKPTHWRDEISEESRARARKLLGEWEKK